VTRFNYTNNRARPRNDVNRVVGGAARSTAAQGFLKLADRLVGLAFPAEGLAEVVVREVIVLRDYERLLE
jgi:hypothetical protein